MRMSDRITFITRQESYYDPVIGDYVESEPIKDTKPCKLSAMGIERTNQVFGTLDKQYTIARLQHPYNKEFDYIVIENGIYQGKYQAKRQSNYRKGVFYLEGDISEDNRS